MRALAALILVSLTLAACESSKSGPPELATATLYRNSTFVSGMRIHWATFDADDAPDYNINNCMMAARLLNANLIASAGAEGKPPHEGVGFWCEPGGFRPEGRVPGVFKAEYPTDV